MVDTPVPFLAPQDASEVNKQSSNTATAQKNFVKKGQCDFSLDLRDTKYRKIVDDHVKSSPMLKKISSGRNRSEREMNNKIRRQEAKRILNALRTSGGEILHPVPSQEGRGAAYVHATDKSALEKIVEHIKSRAKVSVTKSPAATPRVQVSQTSGIDVILSLKNAAYRKVMFEEFRKIKDGTEMATSKTILMTFKEKVSNSGGQFYKLGTNMKGYVLINEDEALEKIRKDISRRKKTPGWDQNKSVNNTGGSASTGALGKNQKTSQHKKKRVIDANKEASTNKKKSKQLKHRENNAMFPASKRSPPSRFAKAKNSNGSNMYFKERLDNDHKHNVCWFDDNVAFERCVNDPGLLKKNIGQFLAKNFLSDEGWIIRGRQTTEGIGFISYKGCRAAFPKDMLNATEGVNKFTGYESLAEWAYQQGIYQKYAKKPDCEAFLKALGIDADPYSVFKEKPQQQHNQQKAPPKPTFMPKAGAQDRQSGSSNVVQHGEDTTSEVEEVSINGGQIHPNVNINSGKKQTVATKQEMISDDESIMEVYPREIFFKIHCEEYISGNFVAVEFRNDANDITFADIRQQIEEDIEPSFDFVFDVKTGNLARKQEKKWSVRRFGLMREIPGKENGLMSHPFPIYIKQATSKEVSSKKDTQVPASPSKVNNPPPTAIMLRKTSQMWECDHMRVILPRMARALKLDVADINVFKRLDHKEVEWTQTRKHLYPGPNESWTSEHEKGEFTTASTHAKKLMVPIHMPDPDHFLGLIRFKAPGDYLYTWQFALIDSLDNDRYLANAQFLIENRSTLANGLHQISNDTPNVKHSDATWARVGCVKQGELECGPRMILHFYIAASCESLSQFEEKIEVLKSVENLPSLVRKWAVDLLQADGGMVPQPEWLRNVLGL